MSINRASTCDRKNPNLRSQKMHTFDRIEWLKKRVPSSRLIDRTVKLQYLVHPAEMAEHNAIQKVFDGFDDDGNRIFIISQKKIRYFGSGRSKKQF